MLFLIRIFLKTSLSILISALLLTITPAIMGAASCALAAVLCSMALPVFPESGQPTPEEFIGTIGVGTAMGILLGLLVGILMTLGCWIIIWIPRLGQYLVKAGPPDIQGWRERLSVRDRFVENGQQEAHSWRRGLRYFFSDQDANIYLRAHLRDNYVPQDVIENILNPN